MLITIITLHLATAFVIAFFMPLSAVIRWPAWVVRLHARWRVSVLLTLALSSAVTGMAIGLATPRLTVWVFIHLVFLMIGWKLHASRLFKAVDYRGLASALLLEKLPSDTRMIIVASGSERRAYPLNLVAQHHIVNDKVGENEIAVTFCPMCHTSITFDTTGVGPLRVATLFGGNMVFADVASNTWWQQATGESMTGPLHPKTLALLFTEVLPWSEASAMYPNLEVIAFFPKELLPFSMPIPGLMKTVLASQFVPGLRSADIDKRLPAREMVVGIDTVDGPLAWRLADLEEKGWAADAESKLLVLRRNGVTTAFYVPKIDAAVGLAVDGNTIINPLTGSKWDLRGGSLTVGVEKLEPVRISEEYWFAWARFHPRSRLAGLRPDVSLSL